jgi:hypothetical protein
MLFSNMDSDEEDEHLISLLEERGETYLSLKSLVKLKGMTDEAEALLDVIEEHINDEGMWMDFEMINEAYEKLRLPEPLALKSKERMRTSSKRLARLLDTTMHSSPRRVGPL